MSAETRSRKVDLVQLRSDLYKVGQRRLAKAFMDPDGRDEKVFPILARVTATALPVTWAEDPTRALKRLMRTAIARLPGEKPKHCAITWKEIGTVLYGFRTDLPTKEDGTPYSYNDYRDVARDEAAPGMPERSFGRKITAVLRSKLAVELLAIEADVVNGALDLEAITVAAPTSDQPVAIASTTTAAVSETPTDAADPDQPPTEDLPAVSAAEPRESPRSVSGRTVALAVLLTVLFATGLTVAVLRPWQGTTDTSSEYTVNPSPVPAPASSPPVSIENVTVMKSQEGDVRFALSEELKMSPSELAQFNRNTVLKSRDFSPWYAEHGGVPIGVGLTTITLRGNAEEAIRITDMQVLKDCISPYSGTYFGGYTAGAPEVNIRLGVDLDSPRPTIKELAFTGARGLHAVGPDYFTLNTIELAPGEVETLTIGALTQRYSCSFTLRIIVATPDGSYYQDIDYHGEPFKITADAPPAAESLPLSGYRTAYIQDESFNWSQIDPSK